MMQVRFNFNKIARVCHSLAARQRHTPSSPAAVIGLAYPIMTSFRYVPYVACVALAGNPALVNRQSSRALSRMPIIRTSIQFNSIVGIDTRRGHAAVLFVRLLPSHLTQTRYVSFKFVISGTKPSTRNWEFSCQTTHAVTDDSLYITKVREGLVLQLLNSTR